MLSSALITLALALAASARPARFGRRAAFDLANGQAAIALNDQFKTLTADSPCTAPQDACVNQGFAQCVSGKFVIQPCAAGTICAALPLVNSAGTSITCTTQADLDARIAAVSHLGALWCPILNSFIFQTGATAGAAAPPAAPPTAPPAAPPAAPSTAPPTTPPTGNNVGGGAATGSAAAQALQTSLTLDPSVICTNFTDNGQNPPTAGQSPSLTSTNNYINFCALTLPATPLTNGGQITTGSCNPTPIGLIPSVDKMPSAKFSFPKNGQTIPANVAFNITLNILNLQAGVFTNAVKTYFAAPQTLNAQGLIIGHSHVVIETLDSLDQTTPTDPQKHLFFKGINSAAVNGVLTAEVAATNPVGVTVASGSVGVPPGAYRLCTINSSANHQPVIVPVAQHGSLDDCVYVRLLPLHIGYMLTCFSQFTAA
ncbi:hypothetical protein B0H17DRAFT_960638 [Mycena rosella]|uniref:Carbohydrate-binding module family 19 domain-containing protein n=1 Tax=Mycena rosella TaxID=1033263 RepID=A0AAD7C601_MYCRO|nr:hypothetical protein B0H17DRAFT_960638 [Mycena rosella]